MLSYSIAITTAKSTAVMNTASLMSMTREFIQSTVNMVTSSAQQQPQTITTTTIQEELGTNDVW
jgi:hypothetical protein